MQRSVEDVFREERDAVQVMVGELERSAAEELEPQE